MAGVETVYAWGFRDQFTLLVLDFDTVVVATSSSQPGDTGRRHTPDFCDLLEDHVVRPLAPRNTLEAGD